MGSRPRSDQDKEEYERIKLRTTFFGVIAAVILGFFALGFVVQNLLAARNAGDAEWKENNVVPPTTRPNLEDLKSKLAQTERTLDGLGKKQPSEMKIQIQNWLYTLDRVSQDYEERGWWQQATELLKRAVDVDNLYINETSTEFSRRLLKNLGICFLQTKQYEHAQERFQKLLELQSQSGERGYPLASTYGYLGDSYYFQHDWQKALESYNSSLSVLEKDVTKQVPIQDIQTLLVLSRLADCERNLAETNNDYYLKSANAYHLCADSWKVKDKNDPQNYAISLFHLAQVSEHLPADQLEKLQSDDGPNWIKHSGKYYTSDDLYRAAVSVIKEAPVKKPSVLKSILLGYAGYEFSKFDLVEGLKTGVEAISLPNR